MLNMDTCGGGPGVLRGIGTMVGEHQRTCDRCGASYDWRRSTSSVLKMTFCGVLCERGGLGFTLDSLLNSIRIIPREWRTLLAG